MNLAVRRDLCETARMAAERQVGMFNVRRAPFRLAMSILVSVIVYVALPSSFSREIRSVGAWDAGALAMLALAWSFIMHEDAAATKARASGDDPGRTIVWLIVIASSFFSFFASAFVMRAAKTLSEGQESALVGLCLLAVVSSWMLTHTAFILRYAHLYYRDVDGEGEGGLVFPGDGPPNDLDFAYFALVIGMCFQTSDVSITDRSIRKAVLGHSLLSFAYNTAIVALSINLIAGLLS